MMRKLLLATLALGALIGTAKADPDNFDQVARGRYLATAGDCVACHTGSAGPGVAHAVPDLESSYGYAGGRAIETPFGQIKAANITPDRETGIGTWTADQFYTAMHHGQRPDGTHLYPAFPYTAYTNVTRDDSDAIFAYLRTLAPVQNAVDRNTLPFPFNIRMAMIGWNMLFFREGTFQPDTTKSAEWNRGAYLVEGLGHCGSCHTPKNFLGGDGDHLAGGELQAWYAPSLTADKRLGVGDWSEDEIVEYLRTGRNERAAAAGPMAEVVQYSTAKMTESDLKAMAVYLKQPAQAVQQASAPAPLAADNAQMRMGRAIYEDGCKACHTDSGQGIARMFPRLAGSQSVQQPGSESILRAVLQGAKAATTDMAPTGPAMPAFGWRLNDEQVAAVATYIRNSWGNAAPAVSTEDARKMRDRLADVVE
ncbi:c-type cytochrome [Roseomonas elaeocarpi]|uniref:C-type cytochrome n=1 Tax=Roseomonas elaeocarpi TaxID=907779 RepID=A0ABV6JTL6_9PROT